VAAHGLTARLGRLETRLEDAVFAQMAWRATKASDGVSAVEVEAELRAFFRLVAARLGPCPDHRALAELIAERYGANVAPGIDAVPRVFPGDANRLSRTVAAGRDAP